MKNLLCTLLSLCILVIAYNVIAKKNKKATIGSKTKLSQQVQNKSLQKKADKKQISLQKEKPIVKSKIDRQKKQEIIKNIEKPPTIGKLLSKKQQILRKVDWKNYNYDNNFINLKEGNAEGKEYGDPEIGIGGTFFTYKLQEVIYADITSNGVEEAIIIISGEISHESSNYSEELEIFFFVCEKNKIVNKISYKIEHFPSPRNVKATCKNKNIILVNKEVFTTFTLLAPQKYLRHKELTKQKMAEKKVFPIKHLWFDWKQRYEQMVNGYILQNYFNEVSIKHLVFTHNLTKQDFLIAFNIHLYIQSSDKNFPVLLQKSYLLLKYTKEKDNLYVRNFSGNGLIQKIHVEKTELLILTKDKKTQILSLDLEKIK